MHGIWMDECDLEAEQAAFRALVDQLGAFRRELSDCFRDVVDLVRNVVHPRPALGEKLSDRRLGTERGEQLDPTLADPQRRGLHTLVGNRLAVLELAAEEALVRRDGLVEVGDGDAEMVNPTGLHAAGCYSA